MQDLNNIYQSPQAPVDRTNFIETNQSTWYHFSGRIGRLRYLSYQIAILTLSMLLIIIAMLAGIIDLNDSAEPPIIFFASISVASLPIFIYSLFIFPIRRLHDLNKSGWLVLLSFVPVVHWILILYLTFAKGNEGDNQYGAPPRENRWYHWLLGLSMFLTLAFGTLATLLVPSYQEHIEQAQRKNYKNHIELAEATQSQIPLKKMKNQ